MYKTIIILFLFITKIQAQNIYIQKDTLERWRIVQQNFGKEEGQETVTFTPYMDSVSIVKSFIQFMQTKRDIIDKKILESDFSKYDDLLTKVTGKNFETIKSEDLLLGLIGDWKLITGADTMKININSFLNVSGAEINGKIEAVNYNTFLMKRVLPIDSKFTMVDPEHFETTINNNKINLIKNE